jgi:hypothetical protein
MPGAHDDLANAAAGALCNLSVRTYKYDSSLDWVGGDDQPSEREDYRASRIRTYVLNGGYIR